MQSKAPSTNSLDSPIYTIGIAAEILHTHPRTLMMYESLGLIIPQRTSKNRRRYSQRDIFAVQALQHFTQELKVNLIGARYLIDCMRLLDEHGIQRPEYLADVDIIHVKI